MFGNMLATPHEILKVISFHVFIDGSLAPMIIRSSINYADRKHCKMNDAINSCKND